MLGLDKEAVELVAYRPEWKRAFLDERERLRKVLHANISIEHVGSTAVPGLPAKPILDIAVGLTSDTTLEGIIAAVERLEYIYRGDAGDDGGHVFVRESEPLVRTHHVHVVHLDGPQWRAYLVLRDFLRKSPEARASYAAEKAALALRHPHDRAAYTVGKSEMVSKLLAEARRPTRACS